MEKGKKNQSSEKTEHVLTNAKFRKLLKLVNAAISSYELTISNIFHKKFVVSISNDNRTYNFKQELRTYINSGETFQRKQYAIIVISEKKWESIFRTNELDVTDQRNIMHYVQNWVRPGNEVPHTVVTCYCRFIVPTKKTEIVIEIARISINDQRTIAKKIQEETKREKLRAVAEIDLQISELEEERKKIQSQIKGSPKFNQKNYNAHLAMLAGTDARETELAIASSEKVAFSDYQTNSGDCQCGKCRQLEMNRKSAIEEMEELEKADPTGMIDGK